MCLMEDFKKFALKGNVVDMAVGIIIGGAFGKIISSLVADIIMPPIGLVMGGVKIADLKYVLTQATLDGEGMVIAEEVAMTYGLFLQTALDFIIIAFSIFLIVKVLNDLKRKEETEVKATLPVPSKEEELLGEIRDLLKK